VVLEVTLAGAVVLRRGHREVGDRILAARQVRLVTAMLVIERHHPVAVDVLAAQLWPGEAPDQWRVAVRGLVGRVRKALVQLGLDGSAIRGEPGRYVVDLSDVVVDLERASDTLRVAERAKERGDAEQGRDGASVARSILSRPVLAGIDGDWVDQQRRRVGRDHLRSLVVLGVCRSRLGDHAAARSVLVEAVELDPLREATWRALMSAELAAGNAAAALGTYEDCRQRLAEHLGVDPSDETQRLHGDVLQAIPVPRRYDVVDDRTRQPAQRSNVSTSVGRVEPYVGLRAFDRAEADLFFGRDGDVNELVELLARRGLVAVVGPSGVGKSSLVRAGLLPALARGAVADADTWLPVLVTPGDQPRKALVHALHAVAGDRRWGVDDLDGPDGLHAVAEGLLVGRPRSARLLVVVDQFEEVFTLARDDAAADLVAMLRGAAARLDARVAAVMTMRADFYDRAAALPGLAEVLTVNQFVVPPLQPEQVETVVTEPARRAGVALEPGLLGRIVADVADEPGALPLLQHLLRELWSRRTNDVMTRGAYEDLGGVSGALAARAEEVYQGFGPEERGIAMRILLRAVQPGEETGDARRPILATELAGPSMPFAVVESVTARLVDARLLTSDRDPASGDPRLQLAHEALIEAWPRLRSCVDEGRAWLLDARRLTAAAQSWAQHERHDCGTPGRGRHAIAYQLTSRPSPSPASVRASPASSKRAGARTAVAWRPQDSTTRRSGRSSRRRVPYGWTTGVAGPPSPGHRPGRWGCGRRSHPVSG